MDITKRLVLRIKKVQGGGFFTGGYGIVNPVAIERVNGQDIEYDLGDYFITSSLSSKLKLVAIKQKYEAMGYMPVGDWD